MKETTPVVEFGIAVDAKTLVEPPDATALELEKGHPGLGDAPYIERRHAIFALCRKHRLENQARPGSTTPRKNSGSGGK